MRTDYRVRVELDDNPDSALHDPEGNPLPGPRKVYEDNPIYRLIDPKDDPVTGKRREATWAEYLAYEGNPDRHVVLGVIVEKRCPTCGHWEHGASLWGIDFMDDSPEANGYGGGPMTPAKALTLPQYLGEVAREVLVEAGWTERQEVTA